MPYRAWRYALLQADTRSLELAVAFLTGVWAVWLLLACPDFIPNRFWAAVVTQGGNLIWSSLAGMVASFKLFALYWKYPKFRGWAAFAAVVYWASVIYSLGTVDYRMWPVWMGISFLVVEFAILVRRRAVE